MAQFSYFSSADSGSPVLNGNSGSLISLLDAVLVNGYPLHPSLGWTKPIANSTTPHAGCWKQPSGSGFVLYVNDSAPNLTAAGGTREAWATGWETISNITINVGTGSGQFPLPSQMLTSGHVMVRKSNTNDAVARQWVMFADDRTFYLFTLPNDTAGWYTGLFFGDIYSLKASGADNYKCMIHGRYSEASSTVTGDSVDMYQNTNNVTQIAFYVARTGGGGGNSVAANKCVELGRGGGSGNNAMAGVLQTPNSTDNSLYVSPIYVIESSGVINRGRMRGMYHLCHAIAGFTDGQTFSGGNEYAGKTFQVVNRGYNGGQWVIEISNTLETN